MSTKAEDTAAAVPLLDEHVIKTGEVIYKGKAHTLTLWEKGLKLVHPDSGTEAPFLQVSWRDVVCACPVPVKTAKSTANKLAPSESESSPFLIHYIVKNKKTSRCRHEYIQLMTKDDKADSWISKIEHKRKEGKPQKLMIVINPIGGKKIGRQLFEKLARPLFTLAGIELDVIVTERAGHATDIANNLNPSSIDGLVVVGGDGMYMEVMEPLLKKAQDEARVNVDNPNAAVGQAASPNWAFCRLFNPNYTEVLTKIQGLRFKLNEEKGRRSSSHAHYISRALTVDGEMRTCSANGVQNFNVLSLLVVVGGDGMYMEVLHPLVLKAQEEAGVNVDDPEAQLVRPPVMIGILPAGTGNGMSNMINGVIDFETAALNIIRGETNYVGVFAIHEPGKLIQYCGLLLGYGLYSALIEKSEELRWMKTLRYAYLMIAKVFGRKRVYDLDVEVLQDVPHESSVDEQVVDKVAMPSPVLNKIKGLRFKLIEENGGELASGQTVDQHDVSRLLDVDGEALSDMASGKGPSSGAGEDVVDGVIIKAGEVVYKGKDHEHDGHLYAE
nr:hypothetical protein BaRGS_030783 [Batillaria attramentaria]